MKNAKMFKNFSLALFFVLVFSFSLKTNAQNLVIQNEIIPNFEKEELNYSKEYFSKNEKDGFSVNKYLTKDTSYLMSKLNKMFEKHEILFSILLALIYVVSVAVFVFWAWMFIHAIAKPVENKLLWILIMWCLSFIGSLLYFFMVWRKRNNKNLTQDSSRCSNCKCGSAKPNTENNSEKKDEKNASETSASLDNKE